MNMGSVSSVRNASAGARQFDVVIIGGGLAGLSLAVALRNSGLSLALVEGQPPARLAADQWDARVYAISPGNVRFLDEIGIWAHVATGMAGADGALGQTRLAAVETMDVFGDARGRLSFSAYEAGVDALAWIAESSLLQGELWETVRRQGNLGLYCPARPAALSLAADAACLTLEDGRQLTAQLVVAADGAQSWTRQAAGIEVRFHAYEQMGVVANFSCARPHDQTAFQWFRPDGVLAWLPLPGQRLSMVWSTSPRHAAELQALSAEALCARVAEAGRQRLGALELLTPPAAFPLRLMRAPQAVAPRLALIGDAAHTIHPLSGHGINLGFQDARELACLLSDKPPHIDCGDVRWLRRYERARGEEVVALQSATHVLQRLFGSTTPPLGWLRNTGLNLTQSLPLLKNVLVRYAMG